MRTEFLLCFAVFAVFSMPFAFGEEQSMSVNGFSVTYSSETAKISKITLDQNLGALNVELDSSEDDVITITMPRALIDAKISNMDDDFYLLIDDIESPYNEDDSTDKSRTLIIPVQSANKQITIIGTQTSESAQQKPVPEKSGCLIATATYGTELAPQVQLLREIRNNVLFSTTSGTTFMSGFNQFYYSFSPAVSDLERTNPHFKELVKVTLTPMIFTLSILNYADVHSEQEMLGYGIGIILLNVGMYFVAPAIIIVNLRQKFKKI